VRDILECHVYYIILYCTLVTELSTRNS